MLIYLLLCRYVAVKALQNGSFPRILISGGYGHSTAHLYSSVSKHPLWHPINTAEGRCDPASCLHYASAACNALPTYQ
jgi:hypothetical protein